MSYSDYGLDEVKKSQDEGGKGLFYCPWCQNGNMTTGFSLCFSNFCICLNCLATAKDLKSQWKADDGEGCFKCSKGAKGKKVYDKLFYDPVSGLSICEECIDWGKDVLTNQEKYFNDMVQDILKRCVVDGNVVKLPEGQLDRKEYLDVKNKLELIGGKWKGNKIQGFVFEEDPTELLEDLQNGDDRNLKKEFQFSATPKDIAKEMALLLQPIVTKNAKWLEPSAGDGALVKAVGEVFSLEDYSVDCYELMPLNQKKLLKVPVASIVGEDFLQCDKKDYYDIIIANPPFTKNQDIDHIRKMFEVLKPGGTIITLCSPSWYTGSQKKQVEFKEWLESMNVFPVTLPAKSFQESGTNITPLRLMIQKPAGEPQVEIIGKDGESMGSLNKSIVEAFHSSMELDVLAKLREAKVSSLEIAELDRAFRDTVSPFALTKKAKQMIADGLTIDQVYTTVRSCRICGCTDNNCLQCIVKTGQPCYWVDDDLCSACANEDVKKIFSESIAQASEAREQEETLEDICFAQPMPDYPMSEPQQILKQIKETNKEIDQATAELEQMLSTDQTKDMSFFQQLFDLVDGIDVTLRIKRVDGKLKLEVLPQAGASLRSAVISGTPEDLDAGFFDAITVPVQKAKGLKLEFEEFHKSVVSAKEDLVKKPVEVKEVAKKEEPAKAPFKKVEKPKEEVKYKAPEPSLFD